MLIGFVFSEILATSYVALWLYITDHGDFGVAHALYHVTLIREVQNNHYLPVHYATFMRLR